MGNFHRISKDYTVQLWNVKELYYYLLSTSNIKVKCAEFYLPIFQKTFRLKCNYNSREMLKFMLELEHQISARVNVIIWFDDGSFVDYGYGRPGPGNIEIPEYLK